MRQPLEPTEFAINSIVNNKQKLATVRSRLSDISWWMRLLSQNIAQRANREDNEIGKFFQARYRAVRLLDETAILACAAYVDPNPIRAALAETIEESDFTSAQKRAAGLRREFSVGSIPTSENPSDGDSPSSGLSATFSPNSVEKELQGSRHLAPVKLRGGASTIGPCLNKQGARCSNKGFLPISTAEYLNLLDWTARQTRSGKRGATPKQFAPLFDTPGDFSGDLVSSRERFWRTVQRGRRSASTNRRASLERQFSSLSHSPGNPRVAVNGLARPAECSPLFSFCEYGSLLCRPLRFEVLAFRGFRHADRSHERAVASAPESSGAASRTSPALSTAQYQPTTLMVLGTQFVVKRYKTLYNVKHAAAKG